MLHSASQNETFLRFFRHRGPKRTITARTDDKLWFDDRCVLGHRAKERAYSVSSHGRTQDNWEEHRVACRHAQLVYEDADRVFIERSKSLLTNEPNPQKW